MTSASAEKLVFTSELAGYRPGCKLVRRDTATARSSFPSDERAVTVISIGCDFARGSAPGAGTSMEAVVGLSHFHGQSPRRSMPVPLVRACDASRSVAAAEPTA